MEGAALSRLLILMALLCASTGFVRASRNLLDTEGVSSEGRRLATSCIYSSDFSTLTCTGYPYPACCTIDGSTCYEYASSVECTDPYTPYPGCCSVPSTPSTPRNPAPATPTTPSGPSSTVPTTTPNNGGSSTKCFPGFATVTTPQGEVAMRDLTMGDKVLSVNSNGQLQYMTVLMFSHLDSKTEADFIVLRTSANKTITLTPGHYLWATISQPTRASHVPPSTFSTSAIITKPELLSVGDFLWVRGRDSTLPSQVTDIANVKAQGLYNPHVIGGTILVNGVAALTFPSNFLPPSPLVHRALVTPVSILSAFLPQSLAMDLNAQLLKVMGKSG